MDWRKGPRRIWRTARHCAAATVVACAGAATSLAAQAGDGPRLLVTIAQLGEPLGRILGDCAEVETLLGPGVDPHLYRLTRTDTAKALAADGIVSNGLYLEAQMRALFGRLSARKPIFYAGELVDAARLIHVAGTPDPHIWMDPRLWSDVLDRTVEQIVARWPECAAAAHAAKPGVLQEIAAADAYVEAELAKIPAGARVLITAHDAFGYFGRRYGMEVRGVQGLSTESEAGVAHIRDLARLIAERKVRAVFAETSTAERAIEAVIEGAQAIGANVAKGPPLFSDAMGPPGSYEGRYVGMLDHNATAIARALGGDAPAGGMSGLLSWRDEGKRTE